MSDEVCGEPTNAGGRCKFPSADKCPHHNRRPDALPEGRPEIELSEDHAQLIEQLASYGLTQAQIADCLPFSERTLRNRIADGDHPEIEAAYRRGRAMDARTLSERHRDIALGRLENGVAVAEQRKALEWRMERQHGMAHRVEHSGEVKGGGQQVHVYLPDNQRDDLPEAIRNRLAATNGKGG